MNRFRNSTLKFAFLSLALFYGIGIAHADTQPTPIKLDMSGKAITEKGYLAPGKEITYLVSPTKNNSNLAIQIESQNNAVGFTVWDLGSHLAMPLEGEIRKLLLGVIQEAMEEIYLPNLTWQGHVINRTHTIIVRNEGIKESSFTLTVINQ